MPRPTRPYRSWHLEKLADPNVAADYLNASLGESLKVFLAALGKVAQANQMTRVAKEAGVQRETLYRALSEQGNPTLGTLTGVLSALGLKLSITGASDEETMSQDRSR